MLPDSSQRRFDFEGLLLSLEHGTPRTVLATAEAGVVPFVLAAIRQRVDRPMLVIVPDTSRVWQIAEGLATYEEPLWPGFDPVATFEANDISPYLEVSPVRSIAGGRVAAACRLYMGLGVAAVVLPAAALLQRTLAAAVLDEATAMVTAGREFDRVELAEMLIDGGYERVPVVEDPGTFAVRGGVFDVWSPVYPAPARLDYFGDDVESIRFFDPQTQESGSHLVDLVLPPARELLLGAARRADATDRLIDIANSQGMGNVELRAIIEEIQAGHLVPGVDALLPALVPELQGLLEIAAGDGVVRPIIVIENPDACTNAVERAWTEQERLFAEARSEGRLSCRPEVLFCPPNEVRGWLEQHTRLLVRPFALAEEAELPTFQLDVASNAALSVELRQAKARDDGLRPLIERIRVARRVGELVVLTAHSEAGRQRLERILHHYGIGTELRDEPLAPAAVERLRHHADLDVLLMLGGNGQGFHIEALHLMVVDEAEIFGAKSRPPRRSKGAGTSAGRVIREMAELNEGDYVVHVDHGIGRYVQLVRIEAGGVEQDFLLILYKDSQKLYVPVTQLDRVQKYQASSDQPPSLDRLGSERWARVKGKARKAAAEIAEELVRLYAARQAREGHAFGPPDESYREWEATFPYEETPDQQRAIDEVIDDLCLARPAWRLVCGDVGYGKTEVAIRAAVKVALDGKQVAVLVPTTVLAEQHRLTFQERCRTLPLAIDSLSRFRTSTDQKDVIERLRTGELDIVIGTHRLLSKDIEFRDLGLLVIDEEHRFGVTHKEQMARWRATVDCIVLTATPIPRTLQLATLGLRDLSLMATPPENRKSVRTLVCRGSDEVVREGVERELGRGGQIFYLHNRIAGLAEIAAWLVELVPGVRPAIAHGQMAESDLEEAMLGFMQGRTNVLVCTTIIESGLDIPNANTMFIDRADTLGLAQLYQLRGRVGRSSQRAFCYLLVPPRDQMTNDGAKRVAVLERFSELGSGVHIATHDLEIRGAGNILGEAQTGHIAEVGYELYVKMLEEAVNELRSEELGAPIDPEIKSTTSAWLPDTWIPDPTQRLMAYKRLAAVRDEEELAQVVDRMVDRFGRMPLPALALVETLELRVMAIELGVAKVEQGPAIVAFTLHPEGRLQADALLGLVNRRASLWRLSPGMVLMRALDRRQQESPLAATAGFLRDLLACAKHPARVIDVAAEVSNAPAEPGSTQRGATQQPGASRTPVGGAEGEAPRNSGRRRIVS